MVNRDDLNINVDAELQQEFQQQDPYIAQQQWLEAMQIPEHRARYLADMRISVLKNGIDAGAQFQGMSLTKNEIRVLMDAYNIAFSLGAGGTNA
jgi:hypothetical protein